MLISKQEITEWLDEHKIQNYTINEDLTIDVDGNVNLHGWKLKTIPFQFGTVNGYFDCSCNKLTSLEHCPKTVNGYFSCSGNKLTSLKHCPKTDNGGFGCSCNQLTSLEHCPKIVNGYFYCSYNPLNSIKELFDIRVRRGIVIPEHLIDSNEWKLLQKIKKLC